MIISDIYKRRFSRKTLLGTILTSRRKTTPRFRIDRGGELPFDQDTFPSVMKTGNW